MTKPHSNRKSAALKQPQPNPLIKAISSTRPSDKELRSLSSAARRVADALYEGVLKGYERGSGSGLTGLGEPGVLCVDRRINISKLAEPFAQPIFHEDAGTYQIPALYVAMPSHDISARTLGRAIIEALDAALPNEDYAALLKIRTSGDQLFECASRALRRHDVGSLVIRQARAKGQPSLLELATRASQALGIPVVVATRPRRERLSTMRHALVQRIPRSPNKSRDAGVTPTTRSAEGDGQ